MGLKQLLIDSGEAFRQRSLGYGDNKPLMTKDLPGVGDAGTFQSTNAASTFNTLTDGLIPGGGALAVERAVTDTARVTKFLVTGEGISFLAKEVAGQRMNPQSLISPTNRTRTPLNLLTQIPLNITGTHIRRDGILPINTPAIKEYETEFKSILSTNTEDTSDHTLIGVYTNLKLGQDPSLIKEYSGGASAVFGIGDTRISRYSNPTYVEFPNEEEIEKKLEQKLSNRLNTLYRTGDPGLNAVSASLNGTYNVNFEGIDRVNISNIISRSTPNEEPLEGLKDFIRFRIALVDTTNPLNDEVLLFRAFLEGIQDNFTGEWNPHTYNGRAEKFYTYNGFDRQISFNFKISAQTRFELKPLYTKLNYLVGSTTPVYSNRRMRGRYVRLTIGDWFREMPGFFKSISLNWETNFPWEINQDNESDLSQHPHILGVNCQFQPIHDFTPENKVDTPFIIPRNYNEQV